MNTSGVLRVKWLAAALIISCALPAVLRSDYELTIAILCMTYAALALSLDLTIGHAGQFSVAHAAFYGVGAYTSAILTTTYGLPAFLGFICAGVGAAASGAILSYQVARLKGHYLALASVAFLVLFQQLVVALASITGGRNGLGNIPFPSAFGFSFDTPFKYYYVSLAMLALTIIVIGNLVSSRFGRAWHALQVSETGAAACGVEVPRAKLQVFATSAGLAGITGATYAHFVTFISPESFDLHLSISLLIMVVLGGLRSMWGVMFTSIALTVIQQRLPASGGAQIGLYGVVIVLAVVFMPAGMSPLAERAKRLLFRKSDAHSAGEEICHRQPQQDVQVDPSSILSAERRP